MIDDRFSNDIDFSKVAEVSFPKCLIGSVNDKETQIDHFDNLSERLEELNKQVSNVDDNVSSILSLKETLELERKSLSLMQKEIDEMNFAFERKMREEHQRLNDLKIDFEQEKTKTFNEIQSARELLEKDKIAFEKYRQEQLSLIERNKKILTKNYEQFEKIVSNINEKIDNFDN